LEEIKVLGSNYNFWELIWSNQGLNCINIEVWWPIRDLIEEIWNQEPNWKRRVNRGAGIKTGSRAKLKKLEVYCSIKGQITLIQDQGPKWKRRPTSGPLFEFGRDVIELIFTIKIAIEDAIEQITNWGPMWTLTHFSAFSFKWNDAFYLKQRRFIHC
jgi:hypothetical protein